AGKTVASPVVGPVILMSEIERTARPVATILMKTVPPDTPRMVALTTWPGGVAPVPAALKVRVSVERLRMPFEPPPPPPQAPSAPSRSTATDRSRIPRTLATVFLPFPFSWLSRSTRRDRAALSGQQILRAFCSQGWGRTTRASSCSGKEREAAPGRLEIRGFAPTFIRSDRWERHD